MGAGVSSEQFTAVKELYEAKKAEGLADEEIFAAIKAHVEAAGPPPAEGEAPAGETAEPAAEPPVEAPSDPPADPPAE